MTEKTKETRKGDRIAKVLARAGVASRREAERMIEAGRVSVNGTVLTSAALNVSDRDKILIDGKPLPRIEPTRIWRYHKPTGLVTTHNDPEGRDTVFNALPKSLPRVISVGRLDVNSEGLLLLTNDGELARALELPATGWLRRYRVRVFGKVSQDILDKFKKGRTVNGVRYGPVDATLDRVQGGNAWVTVSLREGKNREVRKLMESVGLKVSRLIRVSYGPFELGGLKAGDVDEANAENLLKKSHPSASKIKPKKKSSRKRAAPKKTAVKKGWQP